MSITLAEIKEQSRQRADMESSNFISDAELVAYINSSIAELHDLLIAAYSSDYFINTFAFTTVNGTSDYVLPNDFYKLRGLDTSLNSSDNNSWFTLSPFNFNERNRNSDFGWGLLNGPNIRYRLVGNNVRLSPQPDGAFAMKLWYIPAATKLVADADVLKDVNQYVEYVIIDAAIKMLQKEESDVSILAAQKQAMYTRIKTMAQNRDADSPETISDVYAENNDSWYTRG